jgi:hypothetical protein
MAPRGFNRPGKTHAGILSVFLVYLLFGTGVAHALDPNKLSLNTCTPLGGCKMAPRRLASKRLRKPLMAIFVCHLTLGGCTDLSRDFAMVAGSFLAGIPAGGQCIFRRPDAPL